MAFMVRRLVFYAVAAWAAITVNFFIPRLMPGNAVDIILAKFPELQPPARHALEIELGLGHQGTVFHQYALYLVNLSHANLGVSINYFPENVTTVIGQTIPWTLILVGTATVIAFTLGTLLGILAAWHRGGWLDQSLPAFTFLQATPYFFLGLLLIEFLALDLRWFPLGQGFTLGLIPGWNLPFIVSAIDHSILPSLTIVATSMAGWMLLMRNMMITMFTYAARNAILPSLSGFALSLGFVVAGALVMEIVFSYPGVGLTLYNAVTSDDFPLMQGIFLVLSFAVLAACLISDVIYLVVDPRTRTRTAH